MTLHRFPCKYGGPARIDFQGVHLGNLDPILFESWLLENLGLDPLTDDWVGYIELEVSFGDGTKELEKRFAEEDEAA